MFLYHQTRTWPSTWRNKNLLSSNQWTRFQLRIFQRRWFVTNSNKPANDVMTGAAILWVALCGSLSRLLSVLTDTWPSKFNSSRMRADVAKLFLLAHRVISLSSLGVALRGLPDHGLSLTIPVAYKRRTPYKTAINCRIVYPHLPGHPSIATTCRDMPTACHFSAKVKFHLTII
jgi:hypothetical protein